MEPARTIFDRCETAQLEPAATLAGTSDGIVRDCNSRATQEVCLTICPVRSRPTGRPARRRRREIDARSWPERLVIPKYITKSGRDHYMPITSELSDILGRRAADTDLLFPSWKTRREDAGWAKMLKKMVDASGVDFELHGLRQTFRTALADFASTVTSRNLHQPSGKGLQAVYNRYPASNEMRNALSCGRPMCGLVPAKNSARGRLDGQGCLDAVAAYCFQQFERPQANALAWCDRSRC